MNERNHYEIGYPSGTDAIAKDIGKITRYQAEESEVAGGKLVVVIVVAFHEEETEGGGAIKSRHFPINALIKSSRQAVGGSRMSSTTRRKERPPRLSVKIGGARRGSAPIASHVSSGDP